MSVAASVAPPTAADLLWPALAATTVRLLAAGILTWPHPLVLLAAAALPLALRRLPARRADARDGALFTLALLAVAAPLPTATWLALPCFAGIAWRGMPLAALLLAGLAADGLLRGSPGQIAFVPVVASEAWITAQLATICGTPATASGALVQLPAGQSMLVLHGCSALSLAVPTVLGALTLPLLVHGASHPTWRGPALALASMLALNTLRLLAMALSPGVHDWLHTDQGEILLECVFSLPPLTALLPERRCAASR